MSSVLVENGFGIAISCLTSQPTPPRLYTTWQNSLEIYRGSPDSTNFGPPGDRTIAKIVLSGD